MWLNQDCTVLNFISLFSNPYVNNEADRDGTNMAGLIASHPNNSTECVEIIFEGASFFMNLTFSRNIWNLHEGYFRNKKVFPDFFRTYFEINLLRIETKIYVLKTTTYCLVFNQLSHPAIIDLSINSKIKLN